MKATLIRKGHLVRIDGQLYRVLVMDHVTPGKGRAHIQVKLRNIIEGTQKDMRFRSSEDVERVALEPKKMQFLYADGDAYHFMDTETYEQTAIMADALGDSVNYLLPDTMVDTEWFEGKPLGIQLPATVDLKVVETDPGIKDATAQAQRKPAKLETGVTIQVPSFIEQGELIRVSTIDGSYSERAK
ncbi:MAG: elongation factor P [Acidobacteriota bacterium]|nr:elongation factor P [Acidobacteriota bacterium]MDH3784266.1 elongation factor P [Acidobacteriota bacterium]